jgi:aconitate hydratase
MVEYFGPGTESISARARPPSATWARSWARRRRSSPSMTAWRPTCGRPSAARSRRSPRSSGRTWSPTRGAGADPRGFFDEIVEIDLSRLEPHVVGPHSPDLGRPVSRLAAEVRANGWPATLKGALIGSCTNSSYEDMPGRGRGHARPGPGIRRRRRRSHHARLGAHLSDHQAGRHDGHVPGGRRHGARQRLRSLHRAVEALDVGQDEANTIVSSFNRNFPGATTAAPRRCRSSPAPRSSPPWRWRARSSSTPSTTHCWRARDGKPVRLTAPEAEELPREGFARGEEGYEPPADDPDAVQVEIPDDSERLQLLGPFTAWDGKDFEWTCPS